MSRLKRPRSLLSLHSSLSSLEQWRIQTPWLSSTPRPEGTAIKNDDRSERWPDFVPIFQSVLNNSPSPQHENVCPIMTFTGRQATFPVKTFLRSTIAKTVTLPEAQGESSKNVEELIKICADLHLRLRCSLAMNQKQGRKAGSRGQLPNFVEDDYVLMARSDFHAGELLCHRWGWPRRVKKVLSDNVFHVKDLRNGHLDNIHASRLKLFGDGETEEVAIMSHVLQSETGMAVSCLLGLKTTSHGLFFRVRCKSLDHSEDFLKPILWVSKDVPILFKTLFEGKSTLVGLASKARSAVSFEEDGL